MAEGVTTEDNSEKSDAKKKRRSRGGQNRGRSSRTRSGGNFSDEAPPQNVTLAPLPGEPLILSRDEHCISRKNIDPECLKVMGRLIRYGYRAFLVGGGVRDLLLDRTPKDFDVSTSASPEQIRKLFRNSRIIGRRFKLNHVFFKGGKTIEVSTFRQESSNDEDDEVQTLAKDNTYGDPHTDALRRDLTINGLFYDLSTFSVVDYVGGIEDLNNSIVRVIGEPLVRFTEDPVRMIRAVRHAARTGFEIDEETYKTMCENSELIKLCPKARLFEEFQREISGGYAAASVALLEKTGLLSHLFPHLSEAISTDRQARDLLYRRLERMDTLLNNGQVPRLGLLFGTVLFDMFTDEAFGKEIALKQYWCSSSALDEVEQHPPLSSPKTTGRRKSSPLLTFIDSLFDDVGLPRKERERLERALVTRLSLLEYSPEDSFGRKLKKTASFSDALALLELLDVDDSQAQVIANWKSATSKTKSSDSKDSPKRRKRRSSSRRRRKPRNSSDNKSPKGE